MSGENKTQDREQQGAQERLERAAKEWEEIKREIAPFSKPLKEDARTTRGEWALTSSQCPKRR